MFKTLIKIYLLPVLKIKRLYDHVRRFYFPPYYLSHMNAACRVLNKLRSAEDVFIIVVVGAADGDSSITFARSFKNVSIIAFEPVSETCQLFRKKTKHLSNIKLLQKAISNKIGKIEVNVTGNFKSSSILKLNTDYNKDTDFSKNLSFQKTETVEMSTLDIELENYNNIDLIKLDVQGAELLILKGASQTLKHTNIILIEMSNHDSYINSAKYFEVDAYLRNNDFKLYDLIPAGRNKDRIYEWNAVYLHDKCFKKLNHYLK